MSSRSSPQRPCCVFIAQGYIERLWLDLSLDEPVVVTRRHLTLDAVAVRAAFAKWSAPLRCRG